MGLSQFRLGPNKTAFAGLFQPFRDAIKLFSKQREKIIRGNTFFYLLSPCMALFITLTLWGLPPLDYAHFYFSIGSLTVLIILGIGVYPLLLAGWSSARKYAIIGAIRGVAQTISYEISLALILIRLMVILKRVSITVFLDIRNYFWVLIPAPFLFIIWIISMLAESNRTPFDFAEGESELVSGFNIEYAAIGFAILFIAEYGRILFLAGSSVFLFLGISVFSGLGSVATISLAFFWIWARATYPRYRYDLLINLAWKCLLPQILGLVSLYGAISILL